MNAAKKHTEGLKYEVVVRDKDGKVIHQVSGKSRSYLRQWNEILNIIASQTTRSIRNTNNTVESDPVDSYQLRMNAGTQDSWGIVVGTDDTAVTINDYAMGTQFTNALGASHQTQTFTAPAVAASTCSWTTTRTIVNNSGNPVSIKEIGIYIIGQNGETYNHCGVRDVLGAAVSVPDGGSITVTYTFSVTV